MITLSDGTTTVELHEDLQWADEFAWRPVAQSVERSITGALLIQHGQASNAGRPITLAPDSENAAWTRRSVLLQVQAWAIEAGKTLTLVLRGVSYSVIFRQTDGPVEANLVVPYAPADLDGNDFYSVTYRFMVLA